VKTCGTFQRRAIKLTEPGAWYSPRADIIAEYGHQTRKHSPPSSDTVYNEWSHTCTPLYAFVIGTGKFHLSLLLSNKAEHSFLGVLAKLRKATISFVMSVRLSVY
jgi:hypothetical protein